MGVFSNIKMIMQTFSWYNMRLHLVVNNIIFDILWAFFFTKRLIMTCGHFKSLLDISLVKTTFYYSASINHLQQLLYNI